MSYDSVRGARGQIRKTTAYNRHCSAPFFGALVVQRNQVYSVEEADVVI